MEEQPLLPIRLARDDNEDFDAAQVIRVKDSLNQLLDSSPAISNVESGQSSKPSIYKIPHFMKEINPKPFQPKLVSFGPYHHGKPHLLPMELEKLEVFRHFKTKYGLDVESIVKRVSSILEHLMGSYDKLEEKWTKDPDKFLHLMIVDGCFMLEFLKECPTSLINMSVYIELDSLLLENQLPMKLLDELYFMSNQNQPPSQTVKSLICKRWNIPEEGLMSEYFHILDMWKALMLYPRENRKNQSERVHDLNSLVTPPATQLLEAGIKFERSKTKSLADVSFDPKRGVLSLPSFPLISGTDSIVFNVMAFETLHVDAGCEVTSFIILMNNLINEGKDVTLLASKKILVNTLGNEQDAAELFNKLAQAAPLKLDSQIIVVHEKVNQHCDKQWNKWCASLKHNYFQNPWTIISVIAATLGFALLTLQAVYQVSDYYIKV